MRTDASSVCLTLVVCILFTAVSTTLIPPANAADPVEQEMRALMEQVRKAALKGDATFFQSYFADDMTRVEGRGQLVTKEDALHGFTSGEVKYQTLDSRDMQVHLYGDTAVVTLIYDFKVSRKGKDMSGTNRVTRILVRREGKWQEVAFQATRIGD